MRRSSAVVVLALIVAAQIAASADGVPALEAPLPGFELVADNGTLELYLNTDNTEIAVVEKRSGRVWFSNPQDLASAERIAALLAESGVVVRLVSFLPRCRREVSCPEAAHCGDSFPNFTVLKLEGGGGREHIIVLLFHKVP